MADILSAPALVTALLWLSYAAWVAMEGWVFSRDLKSGSGEKKDRGTRLIALALIGCGLALAFAAPGLWPQTAIALPRAGIVGLAALFIFSGIGLRLWAVQTLGKHFNTAVKILDDHKLVTAGPYRILRHPSYTGGLIAMTGIGLAQGNWISLLAAFAGILISYIARIAVEEDVLRAHFGAEFDAHAKRTWAVLPPVW